jgi:hypothetical protein
MRLDDLHTVTAWPKLSHSLFRKVSQLESASVCSCIIDYTNFKTAYNLRSVLIIFAKIQCLHVAKIIVQNVTSSLEFT